MSEDSLYMKWDYQILIIGLHLHWNDSSETQKLEIGHSEIDYLSSMFVLSHSIVDNAFSTLVSK